MEERDWQKEFLENPLAQHLAQMLRGMLPRDELRQLDGSTDRERWRKRYWSDPAGWAMDNVRWSIGQGLTGYQKRLMNRIPQDKRVAIRGPRRLGKSTLISLSILWFVTTRDGAVDWKCVTTAGGNRQLEKYLWPEVHKWARKLRWDLIGIKPWNTRNQLMTMEIRGQTGSAFAAASDRADLIEGAHADSVFLIYDESKSIEDAMFDAAEGTLSGGIDGREAFALAASTPGPTSGRFYDICMEKPGFEDWKPYRVRLEECLKARRFDPQWVEQRGRQWGLTSALYHNHVLGEFRDSEQDGVIPSHWVELAQSRDERSARGDGLPVAFGVDIAAGGSAYNVVAIRRGYAIEELVSWQGDDTMETVAKVAHLIRLHRPSRVVVDATGVGVGVYDRLAQLEHPVVPFRGAEGSDAIDITGQLHFMNRRSHSWWHLRELLAPHNPYKISLPEDQMLLEELVCPTYREHEGGQGRIKVEAKVDVQKRLGRSIDRADAVVMAFYDEDMGEYENAYDLYSRADAIALQNQEEKKEEEIMPITAAELEALLWQRALDGKGPELTWWW